MKTYPNPFIVVLILGFCLSIATSCNNDDENLLVLFTTEVAQLHLTSATGGGVICCEGGYMLIYPSFNEWGHCKIMYSDKDAALKWNVVNALN